MSSLMIKPGSSRDAAKKPQSVIARKRGLTVKDVARVAGVAVGTVSRVLNDNSTVMPDVREKVLAAMRELNYEPNAVARSMRPPSRSQLPPAWVPPCA